MCKVNNMIINMTIKPRLKKILTLVFIVIPFFVIAQSKQPQWKFPIAFEDASGAKDTIFFVWDSTATTGMDSTLGEYPMSMPQDTFQVYIYDTMYTDSTKVYALPLIYGFDNAIFAKNYIYPIKISWDTSLFNSPFLSSPVNCAGMNNDYFFIFGGICQTFNMLLTDTVTAPWFNWGSQEQFPLGIGINNFGSCCLNGIEENENSMKNFFLFPNPTTNNLTILCPEKETIDILNVNGQIVKSIYSNSKSTTVDLTDLASGVYIVRLKTDKEILINKFIKE